MSIKQFPSGLEVSDYFFKHYENDSFTLRSTKRDLLGILSIKNF